MGHAIFQHSHDHDPLGGKICDKATEYFFFTFCYFFSNSDLFLRYIYYMKHNKDRNAEAFSQIFLGLPRLLNSPFNSLNLMQGNINIQYLTTEKELVLIYLAVLVK